MWYFVDLRNKRGVRVRYQGVKVNQPVKDAVFRIDFPPGTRISDETLGVSAPSAQPAGKKPSRILIHGTVVDEKGQAVAGATVTGSAQITSQHGNYATVGVSPLPPTTTDSRGNFTCEVHGEKESVSVMLRAWRGDAFLAQRVPLQGDALDQPVTMTISPKNACVLGVRVLDEEGKPLAGVRVTARQRPDGFQYSPAQVDDKVVSPSGQQAWTTNAQGRFASGRLLEPHVAHQLELKGAEPFLTEKTEWRFAERGGSLAFGDVTLYRPRRVEGQVLDRQGKPVAGARVVRTDSRQRLELTTAADGHFQLNTVFYPVGILFVDKAGFRFHGQRCDRAEPLKVILTRRDEPVLKPMTTLAPELPRAKRKELAARLLEPYLKRVQEKGGDGERYRVLQLLGKLDPGRLLTDLEKHPFKEPMFDDVLRHAAALGLGEESIEEAKTIIDSIKSPYVRCFSYLELFDAVPEAKRAERLTLLNQALLHGRQAEGNDKRLCLFAEVARRLWALGEKERAANLLREGQPSAKELPTAGWAGYARGLFAENLALIDLPAALELMKDLKDPREYARHHGNLAHKLAGRDPAAAEKVFLMLVRRDRSPRPNSPPRQGERLIHCALSPRHLPPLHLAGARAAGL